MESTQGDEEVVVRSPSERSCAEHALVLRAAGIECAVRREAGGYAVVVAARHAERALAELADYARENREEPPEPEAVRRTDGWSGVMAYACVILGAAICRHREVFGLDWWAAGKTSAALIRGGEWWRTITALTLHADPAHLLANLAVGGLFGLFAAQLLGTGLAWFSIVLAGAGGNMLNALLRPAEHTSVGASTAIFGALGILSAWAWTRRRSGQVMSLKRWTPLIGGVVLLGLLGSGGERTDVGAHVTGFVCGAALGTGYGLLGSRLRIGELGQAILACGALLLVALGWALALLLRGEAA